MQKAVGAVKVAVTMLQVVIQTLTVHVHSVAYLTFVVKTAEAGDQTQVVITVDL